MKRSIASSVGIAGAAMVFATVMLGPVIGAVKVDTAALRDAVKVEGVRDHQQAFQPTYPRWIDRNGLMDSVLLRQFRPLGGSDGHFGGECCG
ncbi:MAG: hypothetical protein OES26_26970 [Gammaproteobacteria bacterium]|nr:hypothetical protein [Gammaproteobacteria bacterium]